MSEPAKSPTPAGPTPTLGRPLPHESAVGHVTGSAPYVDDLRDGTSTCWDERGRKTETHWVRGRKLGD